MAGATRFTGIAEVQSIGKPELDQLTASVNKFTDSLDGIGKKAAEVQPKADGFAAKLQGAIQNPLQAASAASSALVQSLSGVSAGLAAGATVAGAFGVAMFKAAQSAGNLAEQHSNMAMRLGMSIKEYGLFAAVAEDAGMSGEMLTSAMRGLTRALSEETEEGKKAKQAMADMGIEVRNQFGGLKSTKEILLDIADGLSKMPDPVKQKAAIDIFERAGLQILPLFRGELRETLAEYERMGVGFDAAGAKTAQSFDDAMDRMTRRLKTWMKDFGVGSAEVFQNIAPGLFDTKNPQTGKYYSQEQRERYFAGLRATGDQARRDYEITNAGGLLPFAPNLKYPAGPGEADLNQQLVTSRRRQINELLNQNLDATGRLKKAEEDLAEARRKNDLEGVRQALQQKKDIEAEIEA
ncbi:MAG: phage tail tape measure protein, partial [Bryobacteraceae bacterium]